MPQQRCPHPTTASRIQQPGTSHVPVHPPLVPVPAACPGRLTSIPAALEQARHQEAKHRPPPGALHFSSLQPGPTSRLAAGPVSDHAGTCLLPFSRASVPNQSIISIQEKVSPPLPTKCYCFSKDRSSCSAHSSSAQDMHGTEPHTSTHLAPVCPEQSPFHPHGKALGCKEEDEAGTPQMR